MKQTTTNLYDVSSPDDGSIKDAGSSQLPSVLKVTVVFLCLVIVVYYATAPPVVSLADMEKRITSDKDEYYLGETVNVKVQLVNPLDHEVRLEPITRITYGTTQAGLGSAQILTSMLLMGLRTTYHPMATSRFWTRLCRQLSQGSSRSTYSASHSP